MSRKLTIRHRIAKDIVEDYLYECAIDNIDQTDDDTTYLEDGEVTEITDGENDCLCDILGNEHVKSFEIDNNGDYVVVFEVEDVEDYDEEDEEDDD